ncbi:MAG: restriction endonuclease subunit S [Candidatus Pacearchaeota archaeon]
MKNNWQIKTLGEVCEIINGGTPDTKKKEYWDGENLWITPKDMGKLKSIYVGDTFRKLTEEGIRKSSATIMPENSIILSSRAPIGHLAINTKPMSTNQGCKGIVPKKGMDTKFIYYFLKKSVKLLNELGSGTTFKELSGTKLSSVVLPVPSIETQKQIVKLLDEVFESISKSKENAEKNLKNAKELFESYLEEIFSKNKKDWEQEKLKDVCNLSAGGDVPKNNFSKTMTDKYTVPIFSNGINGKGLYGYTDIKKVIEPSITISARGTIGYPEIRKEPFYPVIRLIVVTPNKKMLNLDFLKYSLDRLNFVKSGTSIPQLTVPMIKEYEIHFPKSLEEQKTIVQKLDLLSKEIKELESIYEQKVKDLEELKKSMLQKAFSGELTKE